MKKLLFLSIGLVLLGSCSMQTRYLTEHYIKTNIESHKTGEFSSIKTYSIYQSSHSLKYYLEFTGYKYGDKKGLVIGADKYYLDRQKFVGDKSLIASVNYIELSIEECQTILNNYRILLQKSKAERPGMSEEIYHDFTVNNDLFISYRKSRMSSDLTTINFWIKGEKYTLTTSMMIKKLQDFMKY